MHPRQSRKVSRTYAVVLLGTFIIPIPIARAGDWYVDANAGNCATATGGPSDPFCTITDALEVAVDGDTIHVAPGTYFETLIVDQDVKVVGTGGAAATIVDGQRTGSSVVEIGNGAA